MQANASGQPVKVNTGPGVYTTVQPTNHLTTSSGSFSSGSTGTGTTGGTVLVGFSAGVRWNSEQGGLTSCCLQSSCSRPLESLTVPPQGLNWLVVGFGSATDPTKSYQDQLQQMTMGQFSPSDPSYQWRFDQGQLAAERSLASKGLLNSGNAAIELTELWSRSCFTRVWCSIWYDLFLVLLE
jgi:hypothetical protein